jgi:opacity protein-like surface antigen
MKSFHVVSAVALLSVGTVQAQLLKPASPSQLQVQPAEPFYMRNEAANPNDQLMQGFRTDPRLVGGINLNRNLAIEMGLAEVYDRGFHWVDPGRPEDVSGALGAKGLHSYLAGKLTVPVDDKLSAYGQLGIAYSERKTSRKNQDGLIEHIIDVDAGPYLGAGAKYKLSDKASVDVDAKRYGETGQKWGRPSNGNGVGAKVKLGF